MKKYAIYGYRQGGFYGITGWTKGKDDNDKTIALFTRAHLLRALGCTEESLSASCASSGYKIIEVNFTANI